MGTGRSHAAFTEKFLKTNCDKAITIDKGNHIHTSTGFFVAYGNVVIDPQKYPNAMYKWTMEVVKVSGNIIIGITSSPWKVESDASLYTNHDIFFQAQDLSYGYIRAGGIYASGFRSKGAPSYNPGDIITVIVDTRDASISFYKNGKYVGNEKINTEFEYKLAIQMSMASMTLKDFCCVMDPNVLVSGFVKTLHINDQSKQYGDIINLIAKYCSFFDDNK